MRVAVYYAPAADDGLHAAGSSWLGRDVFRGACPQPALPGISEITAEARRYGFHATLKPPMRLRDGVRLEDVVAAASGLVKSLVGFEMPRLAVADLHGFLALQQIAPDPALQVVADACVAWFDDLRAPPDSEELARRRAAGLSPPREANLRRWGYPDVFVTWRFHMTLTRRLTRQEQAIWHPLAEAHFSEALAKPRHLQDLCIFTEPQPGAPFNLVERIPLRS